MTTTINLGYLPQNDMRPLVPTCKDCGSVNIESVRAAEPSKKAVSDFVRARAARLGLSLSEYNVAVDKATGAVTATPKATEIEVDYT